jgi:type II secretory pathway pseudopilin PulG
MADSSTPLHRIKAFTLLEISVVLVLISLVLGAGITVLTASIQQSQYNATVATMQAIDDALYKFRLANNRLPCPGDLTIAPGVKGYGFEAGALTTGITSNTIPSSGVGLGFCSGSFFVNNNGSYASQNTFPNANFTAPVPSGFPIPNYVAAEGAVPTRAIGLPDSYMLDGWGNHIRYAVDVSVTATNAFVATPNQSLNACSTINVQSTSGANRTTGALYALVSHGANGSGAFTQNGTMSGIIPTDSNEQTDCHYTGGICPSPASGSTTSLSSAFSFMQKLPIPNGFDDIVTFKERWQLASSQDSNLPPASGNGIGLIVGANSGGVGYIYPYQRNGANFSYAAAAYASGTATVPANMGSVSSLAFSPDNNLLVVAGQGVNNMGWMVYSVSGGVLTIGFNVFDTGTTPSLGASFSPDGRMLVMSIFNSGSTNYIPQVLPYYTNAYAGYVNPAMWLFHYATQTGLVTVNGAPSFSPDGKYFLWLQATTPLLNIFNVNCSTFSTNAQLSTTTGLPAATQNITSASFSNDDRYLAVGATVQVGGINHPQVLIYKNGGGSFTQLATPLNGTAVIQPPGTTTKSISFSHNGRTLAVVTDGFPYLFFYLNNRDDTFSPFAPIAIGAGLNAAAVAWSADDQIVAVANGAADKGDTNACGTGYAWCGLALYQVIGTTVNPMSAVANPPAMNATAVAFPN